MVNIMFSEKEIEYLKSQHIARIATAAVSPDGSVQPDVVPVGFDFDGEYFCFQYMYFNRYSAVNPNLLPYFHFGEGKSGCIAVLVNDAYIMEPLPCNG